MAAVTPLSSLVSRLVLDYLNIRHAEASLTAEEIKEVEGVRYRLTRWTDARHFFKRIIVDDGAGQPAVYVERVAKFTLQDFERMFALHDLSIDELYGDYRLNSYDALTSPRLILLASKSGAHAGRSHFRDGHSRTRLSVSVDTPGVDVSLP